MEDGGLIGASEEAGGGDGGEFTTAGDGAGTGVFLTVGDGAEALGAGACVGDFEGDCEGDWAKVEPTSTAIRTKATKLKRAIVEKIAKTPREAERERESFKDWDRKIERLMSVWVWDMKKRDRVGFI